MSAAPAAPEAIAVLDAAGTETGASLEVPSPPPPELVVDHVRYELRTFRECRQFGCGCVWEERIGYVPAGPQGTTNEESEER